MSALGLYSLPHICILYCCLSVRLCLGFPSRKCGTVNSELAPEIRLLGEMTEVKLQFVWSRDARHGSPTRTQTLVANKLTH